jgi:SEC-C motif-containing protein
MRTMPGRRPTAAKGCLCGLPAPYQDCCGRFHRGEAKAPTAERLMRSRFSAFGVGDEAYLLRTWHPATRPRLVGLDPATRWVRLEVLQSTGGSAFHTDGAVRFRAHYLERGRVGHLEEHSRFVVLGGAWLYVGPVGAGSGNP